MGDAVQGSIRGFEESERGRVRGSCGSQWWVMFGLWLLVLVDGLSGLRCEEDTEKGGSGCWVECIGVVGAAWVMRAAGDTSTGCVDRLIDVHSKVT